LLFDKGTQELAVTWLRRPMPCEWLNLFIAFAPLFTKPVFLPGAGFVGLFCVIGGIFGLHKFRGQYGWLRKLRGKYRQGGLDYFYLTLYRIFVGIGQGHPCA
jgi:hypothetical protein